jgi:hypothetical protein
VHDFGRIVDVLGVHRELISIEIAKTKTREEHVLHCVLKYVRSCELSDAEVVPLVQQVRLPFLCADSLATVVSGWKVVPVELKASAMTEHMKMYSMGINKEAKEKWYDVHLINTHLSKHTPTI